MVREWDGQFCLKGVMSGDDAKRAASIGCTGVVVSNHGGRQLDGSRSSFDQLAEIVQAAGDRLNVLMDGGVQREVEVVHVVAYGLLDLTEDLWEVGRSSCPFSLPRGRGDGATHGAAPDARGPPSPHGRAKPRDIFIPGLALGSEIRVPSRDLGEGGCRHSA